MAANGWLDPRTHPCPYCGAGVVRIDSKQIYKGISYGWAWACQRFPVCSAYVGCHRENEELGYDGTAPLGRLADAELRILKREAHVTFDKLWKTRNGKKKRPMSRYQAYQKLASVMGVTPDLAHIGYFDKDQIEALLQCLKDGWFK